MIYLFPFYKEFVDDVCSACKEQPTRDAVNVAGAAMAGIGAAVLTGSGAAGTAAKAAVDMAAKYQPDLVADQTIRQTLNGFSLALWPTAAIHCLKKRWKNS